MKIGLIISDITEFGGGQRVVVLLSKLFSGIEKAEVTIFSCLSEKGHKPAFELEESVRIVHLGDCFNKRSFCYRLFSERGSWLFFKAMRQLKKVLKTDKQDILISTTFWTNSYAPFFRFDSKLILCEHLTYEGLPLANKIMARLFYRFSDAVVLLSKRHATDYNFVPESKKFVIPNARTFEPDETAELSRKRILVLSRFSYEKGMDILILIAEKLKRKIPDWKIDIFGDGEEKAGLKKIAEEKNLNDFLCFHEPTADAKQELLSSSLVLLTSRHEAFPMVILEAQACGVPVIAFDCHYGPGDIIHHGSDGILVPVGDIDGFVGECVRLANDEALRRTIGKNAKSNAENYSQKKILSMWLELLKKT